MRDFARRAYDMSWHIDPIVRSLADIDFYKLSMGQLIWERHFNDIVTFSITNRTADVRLADLIDEAELREQLDYVRTLRFEKSLLIWLRGQTFYGRDDFFKKGYLDSLKAYRLPEYDLNFNRISGQIEFKVTGRWWEVSPWETIVMVIINTMRVRALLKTMSKSQLDITYARAKVKLYAKLEKLAAIPDLKITDFGTRRRHDYLWQQYAVETAAEVLGTRFGGTSNVELAYRLGLEATGTNAHELPMSLAAIAGSDDAAVKQSQYQVLKEWQSEYRDNMLIFLPDTFGTTQFLEGAPEWLSHWKGARVDSKDPIEAGNELIRFWEKRTLDPKNKIIIFADGLDVSIDGYKQNGHDIAAIHDYFRDRVDVRFGWGTNLTNDFMGCVPGDPTYLKPISLVCKVKDANGHPAVKLSDVKSKATGPVEEVARYRRIFGDAGMIEGKPPTV